jgi:subtilase-type serine protease
MSWSPYGRLAWVHEFHPVRDIAATFITLPMAGFTVEGPRAVRDAVRIDAGSKLQVNRNVSLFESFDGEFGGRSQMYTGRGGVTIAW